MLERLTTFKIKANQIINKIGLKFNPEIYIAELKSSTCKLYPDFYDYLCLEVGSIIDQCIDYAFKLPKSEFYKILEKFDFKSNGISYEDQIINDMVLNKISELIQKNINDNKVFKNQILFCSDVVVIQENYYFIFFLIPLTEYQKFNHFNTEIYYSPYYKYPKSIIESVITSFLSDCTNLLKNNDSKSYINYMLKDEYEYIRSAGEAIMNRISYLTTKKREVCLFEEINTISASKYEKKDCAGKLIIANKYSNDIKVIIFFENPIKMNNNRAIRKLLEMTTNNLYLLSYSNQVYGLGSIINNSEDIYIIEIITHFKWKLTNASQNIMFVENGTPKLNNDIINYDELSEKLHKIFIEIKETEIKNIYDLIIKSSNQKKGTTLVISNNAFNESKRLLNQSVSTKPFLLTSDYILELSSIDGAIITDKNCMCYSIGAILDGQTTEGLGDISRGPDIIPRLNTLTLIQIA